ncbi:hypothetical protein Avbf_09383 [Armadillidium vulgare]|nr:hypothetical protein Avbf_09383 [Armadillidium vulgare]
MKNSSVNFDINSDLYSEKSGTNEAQDLDRFRNQTSFRSIRLTAISRLSINNGCLNRRVSFPNSGDSPPKQDSLQTLSGKDSLRIESPDFRISNKVYSHRRPSDSSRILNPKYNAIPSIKVEDTVI